VIEHGRDIAPRDRLLEQYSPLKPLLVNPIIDDEFARRDQAAQTAKKQFHRLGQVAVLMIAASAIFTLAEALVPGLIPKSVILRLIAVSVAGIGILLQLYLILTGQKQKWLLNRYATERLRSIKFQSYQNALMAESTEDLQLKTDAFLNKAIADLDNELNGGIAVLRAFRPEDAYLKISTPKTARSPDLAAMMMSAFQDLRIKYQIRFANSEIERFTSRRRLFNSTQDMVYLAAAIFTFMALGAKLFEPLGVLIATGWMEFLAVSFFIIGATEAILDNALLEEQSQSRYDQYAKDIDMVLQRSKDDTNSAAGIIADMEALCLGELSQFCAAAQKISYRF